MERSPQHQLKVSDMVIGDTVVYNDNATIMYLWVIPQLMSEKIIANDKDDYDCWKCLQYNKDVVSKTFSFQILAYAVKYITTTVLADETAYFYLC